MEPGESSYTVKELCAKTGANYDFVTRLLRKHPELVDTLGGAMVAGNYRYPEDTLWRFVRIEAHRTELGNIEKVADKVKEDAQIVNLEDTGALMPAGLAALAPARNSQKSVVRRKQQEEPPASNASNEAFAIPVSGLLSREELRRYLNVHGITPDFDALAIRICGQRKWHIEDVNTHIAAMREERKAVRR